MLTNLYRSLVDYDFLCFQSIFWFRNENFAKKIFFLSIQIMEDIEVVNFAHNHGRGRFSKFYSLKSF